MKYHYQHLERKVWIRFRATLSGHVLIEAFAGEKPLYAELLK